MAMLLLHSARRALAAAPRLARSVASVSSKIDLDLTLQEARSWDEGVESKFERTPLSKLFKGKRVAVFGVPGAFTGVCTQGHVPSYTGVADKIKAKGVDSIICVAVNDPYCMNAWVEKMKAEGKLDFYADFDGSFHKSLGLTVDLSAALLGLRSQRWSALVEDGVIKVLNVEKAPSDLKVSDGNTLLKQI